LSTAKDPDLPDLPEPPISFEPIGDSPLLSNLNTTVVQNVLGENHTFSHDGYGKIEVTGPPVSAAPGAISDRWEVLECIGKGGMGVVYKARHTVMNKIVAVKILDPVLTARSASLKRFQQEAQAAASLNHPNVVTVYDCGVTPEGYAFMIMDYLNGRTLAEVVRDEGNLTPGRALPIFRQTCEALAHAHENKVIHRDLKPSNIMLLKTADGHPSVKIVDFGIAKLVSDMDDSQMQALTRTGELFGSPLYMSPEQCQAKKLDSRTDIYSMGCLMYEALTGRPPFVGVNALDTLRQHLEEPPKPFPGKDKFDTFLIRLEAITMRCLAKDPEDRYQSMSELCEDLKLAHEGSEKGWRSNALALKQLPALKRMRKIKIIMPVAAGMSALLAVAATLVVIIGYVSYSGETFKTKYAHQYDKKGLWSTLTYEPVAERPDFLERFRDQQFALPATVYNGGFESLDYAKSLLDTAQNFQENGHWREAINDYHKALKIVSNLPRDKMVEDTQLIGAKINLGLCLLRENRRSAAVNEMTDAYQELRKFLQIHLDASIKLLSMIESVYSEDGNLLMAERRINELIGLYRQAGARPDSVQWRLKEMRAACEYADIQRRKGDSERALRLYLPLSLQMEALKAEPSELSKVHYGLGLAYANNGQYKEAAQQLEAALQNPMLSPELKIAIDADYRTALWHSDPWRSVTLSLGELFTDRIHEKSR